jgi:hypothetical protein
VHRASDGGFGATTRVRFKQKDLIIYCEGGMHFFTGPQCVTNCEQAISLAPDDSKSTGAGPGQKVACNIRRMICGLRDRTVNLVWVKGHEGTTGKERAEVHADKAAEIRLFSQDMSIA